MKRRNLIHKVFNRLYTILSTMISERTWHYDGINIKYIWVRYTDKDCSSRKPLIVSFPACWANGAKYNYMGTLKRFNCNKLFLLDDAGNDHCGNYLMGDRYERAVSALINHVIDKVNPSKKIFIGSSKGASSALNYSFLIKGVDAIIGAPQYRIGLYLNKRSDKSNLLSILGGKENDLHLAIKEADSRIESKIFNSVIRPTHIYILYSKNEPHYEEHIRELLRNLRENNIDVEERVMDYPNHNQIAEFFPAYLIEKLRTII